MRNGIGTRRLSHRPQSRGLHAARQGRRSPLTLAKQTPTNTTVVRPPDVSVVVPVFNNSATLDELLDRLIAGITLDYFLFTARRPFLVSGLVAAAACVLGVALLIVGPRAPGLLLAVAGALGLQGALIGSYIHRIYQLQQDVPFYQLRDDVPQLDRPARNDNAVA